MVVDLHRSGVALLFAAVVVTYPHISLRAATAKIDTRFGKMVINFKRSNVALLFVEVDPHSHAYSTLPALSSLARNDASNANM